MNSVIQFWRFIAGSARVVARGSVGYYAWIALLGVMIVIGLFAYANQLQNGLITTNMRDQISWGFYIGNFAFLVGVAAAAGPVAVAPFLPLPQRLILPGSPRAGAKQRYRGAPGDHRGGRAVVGSCDLRCRRPRQDPARLLSDQ